MTKTDGTIGMDDGYPEKDPESSDTDGITDTPNTYDTYIENAENAEGAETLEIPIGSDSTDSGQQPEALTRYDPLRAYLVEIRKYAVLAREEEHELAERYRRTGDKDAAYRLVTANLRLVVKIAMIYHKVYRNILDLIQEGNLGLLQAVQRFDPERGTRLQTYAAWWIKAYILKFLLDNTRMVKIGTTNDRRKILMNLNREKRELEAKGIVPTSKQLAENLGVGEHDLLEVERGMAGSDISLDAPIGGDGDMHYGDTLHQMEQSVDEKIAQGEFREMLEKKFDAFAETLGKRDREILTHRLIADEPETLQEIATRYGVTREA
ncbi:MAG: sigma-70 family RNA polymerase sigma factor, partial [Acidobacteriota bacterium]|nr:sigma-70 family RNA polymerase sigma factor [Acidobacteriota bacterium]